jgi:pyridoxal phosphate enzyme (YggS family)
MTSLASRLQRVRERIAEACQRVGRRPEEVRILAVTKTHPPAVVEEAIACGVDAIGENWVQEAASKKPQVKSPASWHLVGTLQRNKAKKALEIFHLIATLDRLPLAQTLERLLAAQGRSLPVMLEVNLGREPQKGGVFPEDLPALCEAVLATCPHLQICGLFAVPPYNPDPEASRAFFRQLRKWRELLATQFGLPNLELSMGMSEDYPVAVEEGATWVRLGRALFGPRHS